MDGNGSGAKFPLPSEIADAPGAEGWRSIYPYFTRFQPEDHKRFWFYVVFFQFCNHRPADASRAAAFGVPERRRGPRAGRGRTAVEEHYGVPQDIE